MTHAQISNQSLVMFNWKQDIKFNNTYFFKRIESSGFNPGYKLWRIQRLDAIFAIVYVEMQK